MTAGGAMFFTGCICLLAGAVCATVASGWRPLAIWRVAAAVLLPVGVVALTWASEDFMGEVTIRITRNGARKLLTDLASRPDGEAGPAHADPLRAPAPSPDGGAS